MKITIIHVLGIISIAEIIFVEKPGMFIMLWILYGVYKIAQDS